MWQVDLKKKLNQPALKAGKWKSKVLSDCTTETADGGGRGLSLLRPSLLGGRDRGGGSVGLRLGLTGVVGLFSLGPLWSAGALGLRGLLLARPWMGPAPGPGPKAESVCELLPFLCR